MAALAFLALALAAACGDGGTTPSASPASGTPPATPIARATGSDEPAERDLVDLAERYRGQSGLPRTVDLPEPLIGDVVTFDVFELPSSADDPPGTRTIEATLRGVSLHAYFFVENVAGVPDGEVVAAMDAFEEDVWPEVTGEFGLPDDPGVDGDPRITVLHAGLGPVGGYVTEADSYPRVVVPHSNQREMVYLDVSLRPLGSPRYAQVLAHELQHLIHRRLDSSEAAWLNEGLSEVAAALVGGTRAYGAFLDDPDVQLTAWDDIAGSGAHYAASSLFATYLLEQTGASAGALAAEPASGVAGVEAFLRSTGSTRSFGELVGDWAVATYLDLPEGPYGYGSIDVSAPVTIPVAGPGPYHGDVRQFATDYLELNADDFAGDAVLEFEGDEDVRVIGAQADADGPFWWSGRGDNIDATLTRELDMTGVSTATLTFRTWYDIERWFDYGYVAASRDGGRTWQALPGRETTTDDPIDAAYGPGYTGTSGWVEERIDLSAYAGAPVLLRFEYVTDGGVNEPGWAIDDIAVPEIGFFDDASSDVGGWHREGFRRLSEPLAQRFELRLITMGASPGVEPVALDAGNRARIALPGLGSEYQRAVMVVVATTDGTAEPAGYRYTITGASPP